MQDIGGSAKLENNLDFPMAAFLYTASCMHCMAVSLGQGGAGLGTMWGWETAEAMLRDAGFESPERHTFEHDPLNVWFVARKPERYGAAYLAMRALAASTRACASSLVNGGPQARRADSASILSV